MPTTARRDRGDSAPGPYRWQAVKVDASCVHTHTAPSGSYRAFGASHIQWAGELQVDEVARRAGIDAVEIRRLNLLHPGEQVRPGGKPLDADLGRHHQVADALGWDRPSRPGPQPSVGLLAPARTPPHACGWRRTAGDVLVGSTEMGQGQRTAFAHRGGGPRMLRNASLHGHGHQFTPYDRSTGASRSTTLAGLAVSGRRSAPGPPSVLADAATRSSCATVRLVRRGAQTYPELMRAFGLSGGQLIGERRHRGTGSYAEARSSGRSASARRSEWTPTRAS
jgi:hypothetical protein